MELRTDSCSEYGNPEKKNTKRNIHAQFFQRTIKKNIYRKKMLQIITTKIHPQKIHTPKLIIFLK